MRVKQKRLHGQDQNHTQQLRKKEESEGGKEKKREGGKEGKNNLATRIPFR